MDLKKFVLEGNPVCRKEAVIVGDHFRITMLTTALIRFDFCNVLLSPFCTCHCKCFYK